MNNKSNKKSTRNKNVTPSDILRLERMALADIRGLQVASRPKGKRPSTVLRRQVVFKDTPPRQIRSKKSPTGASYNDGFDAVSPPDRRDERIEDFDELIATVTGTAAFGITAFAMNPGNATSFPRLSKIAQLFEKYRFEQLEFYFQHDVSQFATQGSQGLVLLSALYDASSSAPTSKTQVEATKPRVICMPNQNSLLRCSKARMHPTNYPLYVRPAGLPGGADIKTYDVGNMFLTVQGMAGTGEVGELHVRGKVMLMDEILDSSVASAPINNQVSIFSSTSAQTQTTTVAQNLLAATATNNGLNIVNTAGSFVPPAGNYLVDAQVCSKDTSAEAFQVSFDLKKNGTSVYGASLVPLFNSGVSLGANEIVQVSQTFFITANGTDAFTLPVTCTGAAGTLTAFGVVRFVAI
jgi:hypothetical protein